MENISAGVCTQGTLFDEFAMTGLEKISDVLISMVVSALNARNLMSGSVAFVLSFA